MIFGEHGIKRGNKGKRSHSRGIGVLGEGFLLGCWIYDRRWLVLWEMFSEGRVENLIGQLGKVLIRYLD